MPEHQKWLNDGKFDGTLLSDSQKHLRQFYSKLLNISAQSEAITKGKFYELMLANQHYGSGFDIKTYAYLRYTDNQRILVLTNFSRGVRHLHFKFTDDLIAALQLSGKITFTDMLGGVTFTTDDIASGLNITLAPAGGVMLSF
jgi:hypothetical protein